MRGGRTKDLSVDDLRSCVHSYDPLLEAWGSARATGELPPGVYRGACTAAGEELLHCGGIRVTANITPSFATRVWF